MEVPKLDPDPARRPRHSIKQGHANQLGGAFRLAGDQVGASKPDEVEDAVADPIGIAQGDRAADVVLGLGRVPGVVPREVAVAGADDPVSSASSKLRTEGVAASPSRSPSLK
jgi:hypothetical protein